MCVSGGCDSRFDCVSPKMTGSWQGGLQGCHKADGVIQLCKIQILHTQLTRHQKYVSDAPLGQCDDRAKMEACMISQAEERNRVINHTMAEATALVYLMPVTILRLHAIRKNYSFHLHIIKSNSSDIHIPAISNILRKGRPLLADVLVSCAWISIIKNCQSF